MSRKEITKLVDARYAEECAKYGTKASPRKTRRWIRAEIERERVER